MHDTRPPADWGVPRCSYHPWNPAVSRCVFCNRYLCQWCRVVIGGRNYCRQCASFFAAPGGEPAPAGQPMTWAQRRAREPVFPGATWGVGEALLIFFLAVGAFVAFSILAGLLLNPVLTFNAYVWLNFLGGIFLYSLLLVGTFFSVKVHHQSDLATIGLNSKRTAKSIAWGAGIGVPIFVGAIGLAYLSIAIFGQPDADQASRSISEISTGVNPMMVFLLVFTMVIMAPVCEEIYFRGYLYPALRNRMGMHPAMLLNGLIFAAVHIGEPHMWLIGLLPRMLLGYGLCYIFEKNRNLAGPMVCHGLYNGLILTLSIFNVL